MIWRNSREVIRRKVTKERGQKLVEEFGIDLFYETSAKLGTNVEEVFKNAALILKKKAVETEQLVKNNMNSPNRKPRINMAEIRNSKKKDDCC